ncbi:MAG TPA: type II toxin-antitoxin system prevent-host-death family antitoxin [Candidatus Xenobia bacterium]|nr:type II toxin-antitoxin system prevent-host-death family antitoxin [Candidatus Xenobia bacterium]
MKKVGSREFKNRQGHYLKRVRQGEILLITDRGKAVARVSPVDEWESLSLEEKLEELERQGHLRRGRGGRLQPFKPPPLRGKPLSEIIIQDRG